ncbi:hypothetical protein AWZ03_008536 [Drosophila navojoa]|uniref:DUF4794 domain-containing protein n=1 Tax=Drosophila navojoa TaxID=7232 RepID=A0A484BB86_DRONA|nr:developmental and secondary metabolism regulator VEL1 [Drosophila navojoa]TDG45035.1 hypothetical protein AWZ03_008536 [Drosophila navojoa]
MHLKLLLIAQLLAIANTKAWAFEDNQTLDDVQQPETTTTAEESATPLAAEGLQKANDGETLITMETALPDTTNPTTTLTTETTIAADKEENLSPPLPYHPLAYPQVEPYLPLRPSYNPLAYPQTHPYGYGFIYPQPNLRPEIKPAPGKSTETPSGAANYPDNPGYPYPNFSPYGLPYPQPGRLPFIPGFPPGIDYGKPVNSDKPKSDDSVDSEMNKEEKTKVAPQARKPTAEAPNFGYPPVYVVRRPFLASYPYPRNIGGFGSPYGYGR